LLKPEAFRLAEVSRRNIRLYFDFYLKPLLLAWFSAGYVCSGVKWEEKNKSNDKTLDGHNTERNASPFWPLFVIVSSFIALPFGVNSRQLLI